MKKPEFCRNCGFHISGNYQYCVFCGKKIRNVLFDFSPHRRPQCLYGAPAVYDCTCQHCGKNWTAAGIESRKIKYCSECGTKLQKTEISEK